MAVSNPTSLPVTVPVSNPVMSREENPRTIFSAADLRYWGNVDNIVLGTPPDIATLTDLTEFGRSPTQPVEVARPHLIDVGGKDYAQLTGGRFWRVTAGVDFIPSGTKALSMWFTGNIFTTSRTFYELGVGTTPDTGMSFLSTASLTLQARVLTTGGLVVLETGVYTVIPTDIFEVSLDGVDVKIHVNGTELASVPETGTMANDCDAMSVGRDLSGSGSGGHLRELAIVAGDVASTSLERQRMLAYLQGNQ